MIGITRNYNSDRLILTRYLTILEVLIVVNMSTGLVIVRVLDVHLKTMPLENPFFLAVMGVSMSYHVIFFIILHSFYGRLKAVAESFTVDNLKDFHTCFIRNRIRLTMIVLDRMNETIFSINKYFMCNTMIILLKIIIITIMSSFLAFDVLVHGLGIDEIILVFGGWSYGLTLGLGCMLIFTYGYRIGQAFEKIFIQTLSIKIFIRNKKICHQTTLALLQMTNFKKELSCGLFSLHWPHLFVIIVASFNYLVVMVQFDSMISKEGF
jgi:hypothetical protein